MEIKDLPDYIEKLLTCLISLNGMEEVLNCSTDSGVLNDEMLKDLAVTVFTLKQLEKALKKQLVDAAAYGDIDLDTLLTKIKEENKNG